MKMKKRAITMLALLMVFTIAACSTPAKENQPPQPTAASAPAAPKPTSTEVPSKDTPQTELMVFAAASMTETLEEIADLYAKVEPNVKLTFNFDSSGTLKAQIQEGAECDLFISGAKADGSAGYYRPRVCQHRKT